DHGNGQMGKCLLDMGDQINAIAIGQVHVRQAEMEILIGQEFFGRCEIGCTTGIDPHAAEGDFKKFPDIRFVVNNQCLVLHSACHQVIRLGCAKVMRKRLPPVAAGSASNWAWLASQSSREIYRPSPVPCFSVVKKGSNRCSRSSSLIPGPLSRISI